MSFSIAVLAGGKSSRMGTDKGLVPFMGKPLFQYILDQLTGLSDDIFLITNRPEDYAASPYPLFTDTIPEIGALGGIYSALDHSRHELCVILACDMPFISRALIDRLILEIEGFDVAIPDLGEDNLEPFRAVYRLTCIGPVEAGIRAGKRRAVSFLPEVSVKRIPRSVLLDLDPKLRTFLNINTPGDLTEIEAITRVE